MTNELLSETFIPKLDNESTKNESSPVVLPPKRLDKPRTKYELSSV